MKRVLITAFLVCVAVLPAQAQRRAGPSGPPNPFWGDAQAVNQGEQLYNQNCTLCHGVAGGSGEIGPAILNSNMSAPLRGELNDFQIVEAVRNGVPGTVMAAWAGKLTDDDILKVGAYLHSLRGTAIDNPQPGNVAHGEDVFWGKGQCGSCHTLGGKGGMKGPDLTNIAAVRKVPAIVNAQGRKAPAAAPAQGGGNAE
jgi:mono/diheme cytochrome c family protein